MSASHGKKPEGESVSGPPLRALVLEDNVADFEMLEHLLKFEGFRPDCRRIETQAEFVANLAPGIDVILCDYKLAGWDALRALELLHASGLKVPFIVVSGTISEELAVDCMRHGASDYLLKDRLGRLGQAIRRAIEEAAERRQVENLSARLLKAHEEERRKISRELHDQVGQSMALIGLELDYLEAELPAESPAHARVQTLKRLSEDTVAIVRDLALLLRPSILDELGLIPALNWQASEVSRRHKMRVTVDAAESCNHLPDDYRTCIYRVVQEALHNAVRHANAAHAHVTVRHETSQIRVVIEDDGIGFDPGHRKGLGLLGMEERVRQFGGVLHIDSRPGGGASISILLPHGQVASTDAG